MLDRDEEIEVAGRSIGEGIREFKDGITGKHRDDEEAQEPALTAAPAEPAPPAEPVPAAAEPRASASLASAVPARRACRRSIAATVWRLFFTR